MVRLRGAGGRFDAAYSFSIANSLSGVAKINATRPRTYESAPVSSRNVMAAFRYITARYRLSTSKTRSSRGEAKLRPGNVHSADDSKNYSSRDRAATEADRELVVDELAATVDEDRRQANRACAVLLAAAGGEPSDAAAVRGHGAPNRSAAGAHRIGCDREANRAKEGSGRRDV